jgi:hypothetical protein
MATKTRERETTTAANLEQQAAADGGVDLDQVRRETLTLDELHPDLCNAPAPWGVHCLSDAFHPGGHSWQPKTVDGSSFGDTSEPASEQPVLPGTPEPEQTDYTVPSEASFRNGDLMSAPGLRAVAERLIEGDDSLEHLQGVEIHYFWRRRGGTQGGNKRFGQIKRPGVYESYYSGGKVIFLVALSADHIREAKFSDRQIEAALYRELCKTERDPDDHSAYRLVGPDFSGFVREWDRFGPWNPDLREMHAHAARVPVEDVAAAESEEVDDQGEGEGEADDA